MPNEPNEQERNWDDLERDLLYLVTDRDHYPTLWSVADLGRELDYSDPEAVVYPLRNAALVHKTVDGFVFVTAAAFRMVRIIGHVD